MIKLTDHIHMDVFISYKAKIDSSGLKILGHAKKF